MIQLSPQSLCAQQFVAVLVQDECLKGMRDYIRFWVGGWGEGGLIVGVKENGL